MQVKLKLIPGEQMTPRSFSDGLKGDFVKINRCYDCEAVGDTSELFYLEPCPNCGGKIEEEIGVAKWNKNKKVWEMRVGFTKKSETEPEGFYEKDEEDKVIVKESRGFFQKVFG